MTAEEVERLIGLADRGTAGEMTVTMGDATLTLRKAPASRAAPEAAGPVVRAPAAGVFRIAHPAGTKPSMERQATAAGAVVAFLQVGPCLRPVIAPGDGTLGKALVQDGALVGYGTPLFPLRP